MKDFFVRDIWITTIQWYRDDFQVGLDDPYNEHAEFDSIPNCIDHIRCRIDFDVGEFYCMDLNKSCEWRVIRERLYICQTTDDINRWLRMYFKGMYVLSRAHVMITKKEVGQWELIET